MRNVRSFNSATNMYQAGITQIWVESIERAVPFCAKFRSVHCCFSAAYVFSRRRLVSSAGNTASWAALMMTCSARCSSATFTDLYTDFTPVLRAVRMCNFIGRFTALFNSRSLNLRHTATARFARCQSDKYVILSNRLLKTG